MKPEDPRNQPNLMLIMTDQHFGDMLSCLGRTPGLHTPNLDRLLARGCAFDRAYATQPLCVPSRNSIITGRYPHEINVTYNLHGHPGFLKEPMMGTYLSDAGYDCGYVGKWHLAVPVEDKASHGFPFVRLAEEGGIDARIPKTCGEFLDRPRDRPFFLFASWLNPHDICEFARIAGGIPDRLPNGDIPPVPEDPAQLPPLPQNHGQTPEDSSVLARVQSLYPRIHPTAGYNELNWRQYLWAYHRLVEKVDAQIGELLHELEIRQLIENTVILFTSDHGDGCGAHGWNQKQTFYEECARVPLIMTGPGIPPDGRLDKECPVSIGLDLLPTLLDYAGVPPPPALPGRSLKNLAEGGEEDEWPDHIILQTEFGGFGENQRSSIRGRCVVDRSYKYMCYVDRSMDLIEEQLFHLPSDPGEMKNLVHQPGHEKILERMRNKLQEYVRRTKDPFQPVPSTAQ